MNIFTQFFKSSGNRDHKVHEITTELMRKEARIGGDLFGPVPKGVKREFFCLDETTWIWFEQWKDNGQARSKTTKYVVHQSGVSKSVNNGAYQSVSVKEAKNLQKAIAIYHKKVNEELYSRASA